MINEKKARSYCKEDISKIKNYEQAVNDTTQVWDCHHMTETWWNCSKKDLIENECYYHRKACELIFLTHAEHARLHRKGNKHSEETRRKIGEARKGKTISEETRRKLIEALKGRTFSEDTHRKMSEAHKGKTISEETRIKISETLKGKPAPNKGKTTSVFGAAYKEHYGITKGDNVKLYNKEYKYYKHQGHFSWEN